MNESLSSKLAERDRLILTGQERDSQNSLCELCDSLCVLCGKLPNRKDCREPPKIGARKGRKGWSRLINSGAGDLHLAGVLSSGKPGRVNYSIFN